MEISAYLHERVQASVSQMVALQAGVLADQDPEPLHQLRIQLRRLAVLLQQFEPALRLPDGVSSTRVAKIGRRLGLARDLDVLRDRLEHQLMPGLPEAELNALKPMRKQLRRERRLAFSEVVEDLRGRRYLKLLARLQAWLRDPQFTPLASEALEPWLPEFHTQLTGDLFLLPGWRSEVSDELHALRKRIKQCRYGLSLSPASALEPWLERLKRSQQLLGDLNDLALFQQALEAGALAKAEQACPKLMEGLTSERQSVWQHWRVSSEQWLASSTRRAFHQALLG